MNNKNAKSRPDMALMLFVVLGLILGLITKRVRLGVMLGLIIGGTIVFLSWIKFNFKNKHGER